MNIFQFAGIRNIFNPVQLFFIFLQVEWLNNMHMCMQGWRLWCEGKSLELLDPILKNTHKTNEVMKCIHIGLLCVQEDAVDRPTMSMVVVMLASDTVALPNPNHPAFSVGRKIKEDESTSKASKDPSVNEVTVSNILPR